MMAAVRRVAVLTATLLVAALPASAQVTAAAPATSAPPDQSLIVTDLVTGPGNEALPGMTVVVQYTGWLYDAAAKDHQGRQFDNSRVRGQPISFPLGAGQVIRGWDQGLLGMRVGGKRRLVIAPALAYGDRNVGNGLIPPGSTLIFEVELVAVGQLTATPQAQ